jgi:hypothetical protein
VVFKSFKCRFPGGWGAGTLPEKGFDFEAEEGYTWIKILFQEAV